MERRRKRETRHIPINFYRESKVLSCFLSYCLIKPENKYNNLKCLFCRWEKDFVNMKMGENNKKSMDGFDCGNLFKSYIEKHPNVKPVNGADNFVSRL